LFTNICKGQLPFDYKKDSLATPFDIKKFKKYNEDGKYEFYKEDSIAILQFIDKKGYNKDKENANKRERGLL